MRSSKYEKAVLALVAVALLNALMGVWSRLLNLDYDLFQQVGLRAIAGGCFGASLYLLKGQGREMFEIGQKDLLLVTLRSFLMLVGIVLFTYAINNGNFANVNMIYALPTTALLGFFLLKEKVNLYKLILIFISFLGALMIGVKGIDELSSFSTGEMAAIVSTFLYSLGYITRKWISKEVESKQIAVLGSIMTGIMALVGSFLVGDDITNYQAILSGSVIILILAGLTYVMLNYLLNYGFERADAVTGNNILALGSIFGVIISILLYSEWPTLQSLIGGVLIIVAAVLINYSDSSKQY